MTIREVLDAIQQESVQFAGTEVPFRAYAQRVENDPSTLRLSHALIYDMIRAEGVRIGPTGAPLYRLFEQEVYGAHGVVQQIVDYFAAAARGLDLRRRILLLVGPPGSGKSTIVNAIKRGLERYTRTPAGATYGIKGCPVHEEPMHLIPRRHRGGLGSTVEGDLCPHCRWLVNEVYGGDVSVVPVERVAFSRDAGVGIGTFVATDPGSERLERLVGRVDLEEVDGPDLRAARRAFRLDGELNAANRGLADLVEIFKMDERFLSALLTLSEEQTLKVAGPGVMYADEAIVAQSNLAEFESLVDDPRAAALLDRLVVVKVGYVLSVRDEVRIYRKMLAGTDLSGLSLSPLALPTAATLAVLSRLEPGPAGWDLRRKLHLYDGRFVPDARPEDLEGLRHAAPTEGLAGLSPRYVLNQLANALAAADGCVSGHTVLRTLWEGLVQRAGFDEAERDRWTEVFSRARLEYEDLVRLAVRRATVDGFERKADALATEAADELRRWTPSEGTDTPTMRRIESAIGIPSYRRAGFRRSLFGELEATRTREGTHPYLSDPRLEEALTRLLVPDWDEAATALDGDGERIRSRLVGEWGFSPDCATELIASARALTMPRRQRRRAVRALPWMES